MIDDLPTRPFTALSPPPAGALVAVRAGRGIRRRRRLTGAGAAAASIALVAGIVAASGAGSTHAQDQLVPATLPTTANVPSQAPAVVGPHDAAVAPVGGAPAQQPGPASGGTAVGQAGQPGPATTSERGSGGSTSSAGYRTPALRRSYHPAAAPSPITPQQGPGGRICGSSYDDSGSGGALTTDWCLSAIVTATGRGHDLTVEVCRDSTGPGRLTFAKRSEVDLVVLAGSRTVWRWSTGQPDVRSAHTLDAAADSCWSWTAPWTDVDARGRPLPQGDYTLAVTSAAAELRALKPGSAAFSIS